MMDEKEVKKIIDTGRDFMKGERGLYDDFESDQDLKKPQPPLVKEAISDIIIDLPRNFDDLDLTENLTDVILNRKSSRMYTKENISLLELSYLLWATQGIKAIRGKKYATLRTVACGGARHQFETYMFVQFVDGLKPGLYHYLPMGHKIEFLADAPGLDTIDTSLCEQTWATKASVIFYYSIDCYRVEWRYGVFAHRTALIDIGHVGEQMYLAATALGKSVCGVAAFDQNVCDKMFSLDGENEFICYTVIVGTVSDKTEKEEKTIYQFVEDEGL